VSDRHGPAANRANGVGLVGGGQYYFRRSADGALRLSGSTLRPGALRQEGGVLRNILIIVYLVIGVVVASSNHYFTDLNSLTSVLSALLAVVLWPLILFGVSLHIK
jgi:hypothetical protein